MCRRITLIALTLLWLTAAGCGEQTSTETQPRTGDGETADLIRRIRGLPAVEPAALRVQRDEVIEAAVSFLALLLDDDPRAHQVYMLSDTEVKRYFPAEEVEKYVLPGRATILEQAGRQLREWASNHEPKVGKVQVEQLVAAGDAEPARAGRIILPFRSGVTRLRVSIDGAVKTIEGWRFTYFVVSRPR